MGIDFLTRGISPWGQSVFTHISWDLLWVSFFAGVVFLAAHSVYMLLSAHTKRAASEVDALEAKLKGLPENIQRHSLAARMFHWIMAASMFTLLFTAFLPIVGVQFAWVRVALVGGSGADRLDPLPHHPRHLLHGLLVDLDRPERHPGVQVRDDAGTRARSHWAEAGEVPARQPAVSPGDRRDRSRSHGHRVAS